MRVSAAGVVGIVFLFCFVSAAAAAQPPHVRGEGGMQQLIDDAAHRAPEIRESIDRLDALDVVVYVRARMLPQLDLDGRVSLLSTVGSRRYLVIELACGRSEISQMATLGHELYHAIEIAAEPSVVSVATLADLYGRIGRKTGDAGGRRTFETEAAAAAGQRARRQLLRTTRQGHGT